MSRFNVSGIIVSGVNGSVKEIGVGREFQAVIPSLTENKTKKKDGSSSEAESSDVLVWSPDHSNAVAGLHFSQCYIETRSLRPVEGWTFHILKVFSSS